MQALVKEGHMARVNIEEKIWSKLPRIARKSRSPEPEILGILVTFWHDTQEEKVCSVDREELEQYLRIEEWDFEKKSSLIDALVTVKILRPKNGRFEIAGNKTQIKAIDAYEKKIKKMNASRMARLNVDKNAKSTTSQKKASTKNNLKKVNQDVYQEPLQEPPIQSNAIQCNSKQSNAINNYALELLELWNSLDIIQHQETKNNLANIKKYLSKRMKQYSFDEISQGVKNYAKTVNSKQTYFAFKWPLWTFLQRGNASQFYPGEFVFENYLTDKNQITDENRDDYWASMNLQEKTI